MDTGVLPLEYLEQISIKIKHIYQSYCMISMDQCHHQSHDW